MAETLLIVFVIFLVLGMRISLALGVGTLAAPLFYPRSTRSSYPTRSSGYSLIRSCCCRRRSSSSPATSPRAAASRRVLIDLARCWSGASAAASPR